MKICVNIIFIVLMLPLYAGVDYNSEIQPIFDNSCISCHTDGGTYFGGLDLSSYSEVIEGGNSGNTIVPFDSENSLLWQYVNSSYMPPYGSGIDLLTSSQIDLIAQWIDEGALFEPEEDPIEGRWIPSGFNNVMYEFLNGLRYTYYCPDENGCDETYWNSLNTSDAIPNPNPYDANLYILTINLFFGNEANYTLDWRCEGQVVDFYYDEDDITEGLHSTMYRLSFDYFNSECFENSNECSLTTDDILGPYYFEDAPFRNIIAHEDEPGQRLYISGRIKQNNCENNISGTLIELWQANDEGCYGIVEDCNTGNPEDDYFNLRGKFFSDVNGNYTFESILPGYYGSRPRHIHIKITTPGEEVLVSQLYFENDPYCENDQWCQDAEDRIILLEENESGLHGEIDLIINSTDNGIVLGDLNFDNLINVQDIVLLAGIILNDINPIDFQIYAANVNNDDVVDVLDIIQIINIILSK